MTQMAWPTENASHRDADNVPQKGLEVVLILVVIALIAANILERVWLSVRHSNQAARTSRVAASLVGMIAGVIGAQHGYYELLQRERPLNGPLFDAVSGTSLSNLPTSQWTGWPAMTLVQDFRITGILAILVSLVVTAWSALFIRRKNGGRTLGLLSILMLLVGGGFIPPLFGIIAAAIGSHRKSNQMVLS